MMWKIAWLAAVCWAVLPLAAIAADPVKGPFKSDAVLVQPEKDGICLCYKASKRSGGRWVFVPGAKVAVDVGIVGHGVEAYLSLTSDVVVVDGTTKKTLWAKSVGFWYDESLSFVQARDSKTREGVVLLRVGGRKGSGRFFEIRTGKEKYLTEDEKGLLALDEKEKELRGKPLEVGKRLSGEDSKIKKRRCVRITSTDEWKKLWNSHAGENDGLPEIDFSKHMAVGVFHGKGWNCDGIALRHALDCEDAIELFVRGRYYQTGPEGKRVTPYGIYVIPKSLKKLIVKEDCQGLIGAPPVWKIVGEFHPVGAREAAEKGGLSRLPPLKVDNYGAARLFMEIVEKTKDIDAKWRAVRGIGYLRYKAAVPLLIACLKDDNAYVRANAARALCDMRIKDVEVPLLELIKTETDGGVIEQTSLALRYLNVRQAVPLLKRVADHKSTQTRIWVLQAIGDLGDRTDVPFLGERLSAASLSGQEAAARAIENLAGVDFGFPQRQGPSNPEPLVQRARAWWEKNKTTFVNE
jgi:hypothetical protein